MNYADFKKELGVTEIEFKQYTEGKRLTAEIGKLKIVMSKDFDTAKNCSIKPLEVDGKQVEDTFLLYNLKDAIRTVKF